MKTPWGDPDLQGIWTDETSTPLQRAPRYADQEFFTEEQRAELDKARSELQGRDKRVERGTELDVAGAYNAEFVSVKRTGARTSMIVDPPNGRMPPRTPEAEQDHGRGPRVPSRAPAIDRDLQDQIGRLRRRQIRSETLTAPRRASAALQHRAHESLRQSGGWRASRSLSHPRHARVLARNAGSFRRIVQTPGGVTIFYDVGQGQGWQRNIVMDGRPHLPADVRQWYGDSRGRWEGNTLVVDVTNFSPKTDYQGSRENLHLVERWTRMDADTIEYQVTIEDPTVWTQPWTVKQEFAKQNDKQNRIYYEPRCNEGNYGLPGLMRGVRTEDAAFAKGKGPNPALRDIATDFVGVEDDPLQ